MVTQMGRSAFAVLLSRISRRCMVAIIALLAASSASTMGAFALSAFEVGGCAGTGGIAGALLRVALRFVARSGLREVFVPLALFLVFWFWFVLGALSMAMGAFLAGVLLASSDPSCAGKRYQRFV